MPLHLPQHPPLPSPTPAPPSISSALPNFLHTLCSTAVIDLPTTSLNAAPAFLSYKSEHKLRFIIDFRAYNLAFPKPPPFSLPNLAHLLALRQFNQLFFIKIDLLNCFWSIRLPDTVGGEFCGNLYSTTFTTRRLPFGWSWSPVLAQLTIHFYLKPLRLLTPLIWQYLDDLLIASADPFHLTFLGHFAVHLLESAGFQINLNKTELVPKKSLIWLGKHISSELGTISISTDQITPVLIHLTFLHIVQLNLKGLQRLLGTLQWLSAPASLNSANMATAYALLHKHTPPKILPFPILYSLVCASITTLLPTKPRQLLPPLTMSPIFTDAALVPPTSPSTTPPAYKVASVAPCAHYATATTTPSWVKNQQSAELYRVFHGLRQAVQHNIAHLCITTDNVGTYYTLLHGKISAKQPARLRILRRINRLVAQSHCNLQVMWVPSTVNSADAFSRTSREVLFVNDTNVLPYLSTCQTIRRYWWHSGNA